jgi:hypothetical protein
VGFSKAAWMASIVGKNLAVRFDPAYAVFVHGDQSPSDPEWDRAMAEYRTISNPASVSVLVYSDGGAPTATQRAQLVRIMGQKLPRAAVVTKSVVAKIAAKAVGLFAKQLRVFDTSQLDAAVAHLQLGEHDRANVLRTLTELRTELSGPNTSPRIQG